MRTKKREQISFLAITLCTFLLVVILSGTFVSAGPRTDAVVQNVQNGIDAFVGVAKPIFNALLGSTAVNNSTEVTFGKILVFLLVMFVIMAVLGTITTGPFHGPERAWLRFVIGLIVSLLGVRFLPDDLVTQLALPSSVLVAAITVLIPFVIFALAIESLGGTTYRRIAWVVFGSIFAVLWLYNYEQPWSWIYLVALAAILVAFVFDGTIHKIWYRGKSTRRVERMQNANRGRIVVRLDELNKEILVPGTDAKRKAEIRAEIGALEADLKRVI